MQLPAVLILAVALKAPIMNRAVVTIVPNIGALNKICNSSDYLYACTDFREMFSCSCSQVLQEWRLDVSAHITPLIYLWKLEYVAHEKDHIGDIRVALQTYVNDLDGRSFASLEECGDAAQHEMTGFHHLMDVMKEDSNVKRHPFYRRRVSSVERDPKR